MQRPSKHTALDQKLTSLLKKIKHYSPKFLEEHYNASPLKPILDKFTVETFITKRASSPAADVPKYNILAAITYNEPLELSLINHLLTVSFGFDGEAEPTIILEADIFEDHTDLRVTAMASITADFTNFPSPGAPLLKRMKFISGTLQDVKEGKAVELELATTAAEKSLMIEMAEFESTLTLNSDLEFGIKSGADVFKFSTPGPCQIGNTGFVVHFENIGITGTIPEFGLTVDSAIIIPPGKLTFKGGIPMPAIGIQNGKIDGKGISGKFSAMWDLQFDEAIREGNPFSYKNGTQKRPATFFHIGTKSLNGGFKKIEFVFENNKLISSDVNGQLMLPYFDQPIEFRLNFRTADDFDLVLTALTPEGVVLTKKHLARLNITKFGINAGDGEIVISGGLEPLLFSSEGMTWPKFDVKDLKISDKGQISIGEAWMDLKDLATLDLFGFHFELRKVGFGTENGTHMWIDLSGGLRLIEQIPIGVDVEGFRIKWPQDLKLPPEFSVEDVKTLTSKLGIEFKGVQLTHAVPGVMKLDGLIRFFKDPNKIGFAGDMILDLPAAGFKAEAGLMVGLNSGNIPGDPDTSPFPFFYVYFGFEAAAGIPLGQSGLALKGALGMFGINVSPDKSPEQNWYYEWYKRGQYVGAHPTSKWKDERNAFAIGVGVTITSADGFVKGTRGLLVLAIPGPILIIEGRALVLEGLKPADASEPPLRALAVFDGKEQIVQFNIEAQLELVEDVVEASAMLEAFFDFKDLTNWHLYLGQKEPRERRIRANVLNILKADAYLMLDMIDADSIRARLGASYSITPEIPDLTFEVAGQTIGIQFKAHLGVEADGEISLQPEQFQSMATMNAALDISALGLTFSISAYAELSVDGPSPLQIEAEAGYKLDFPDPIPDFQDKVHFKFEGPDVNIRVNSPLSQIGFFHRFTSESKSTAILTANAGNPDVPEGVAALSQQEQFLALSSPVVYPDSQPVLSFEHDMNQQAGAGFLMNPVVAGKKYNVGRLKFTPTLQKIEIFERKKSAPWSAAWTRIHSSSDTGANRLTGAWLADGDSLSPNVVTARRLQLLTTNALANTTHTTAHNGLLFNQVKAEAIHLSQNIKLNNPDFLKCPPDPIPSHVIDFNGLKPVEIKPAQLFRYQGVAISSYGGFTIQNGCLTPAFGPLSLKFHKKVAELVINFCGKAEKPVKVDCSRFPLSDEILLKVKFAKDKGKNPEGFGCKTKVTVVSTPKTPVDSVLVKCKIKGEFFNCISLNNIPGIRDITVVYKDEADQHAANAEICAGNSRIPGDSDTKVFKPGCFYKIVTSTTLKGEIDTDSLSEVPVELQGILAEIYAVVLNENGLADKAFSNVAYYQTNTPPVRLDRYVKWSYPYPQQSNFFGDNKMVLRFNRAYARVLFGDRQLSTKHRLKFTIRDFRGNHTLIPNSNIQWGEARSATRFPDEETMDSIRPPAVIGRDGLVAISKPAGFVFEPNQRYELIVHHDDAGPSLLSGENDIERNWQLTNAWTILTLNDQKAGLQHTGVSDNVILTGKTDWSNICISADLHSPGTSQAGFVFRQTAVKLSTGLATAFYLVKFENVVDDFWRCILALHLKSETSAPIILPVKTSDTISFNGTNGFASVTLHIIGNTLKVGTSDTTLMEVSENELVTFHQSLPATELNASFKTPLASGKVGLFAQGSAASEIISFRNIQVNQSDLITIPFVTAGAVSPIALFAAPRNQGEPNRSSLFTQVNAAWKATDLPEVFDRMQDFLAAEMRLFKMGVDLEYGICKMEVDGVVFTSKEAYEKARSEFLSRKKKLDASFNGMVQKLHPEVLYSPAPKYNLETKIILTSDKKIVAILIHSPQNLDLQEKISGRNLVFKTRGRLKIGAIKINNVKVTSCTLAFNSDMNMVVLVPKTPVATKNLNTLEVIVSHENYTDEAATGVSEPLNAHHRYDRIVEVPGISIPFSYAAIFRKE